MAATRQTATIENLRVPETLAEALDADWLTQALAPVSSGGRVKSIEMAEMIKTSASKARIVVEFDNAPGVKHTYCLKAFLDQADPTLGGATTILEADFYSKIAPHLSMRLPYVAVSVIDRVKPAAIMVMDDMIVAGAKFFSVLDPCSVDFASQSLDQLARLHSATHLLDAAPWAPRRLDRVAANPHLSREEQDGLFARPGRRKSLSANTSNTELLWAGMRKMAEISHSKPSMLLHGDCHAGNLYITKEGPGFTDWQLIQRGYWVLDVSYHINAILTVEDAVKHERELLNSYLDSLKQHGGLAVDREEAWTDYRAFAVYGFYQWAITRWVKEEITEVCIQRLAAAVDRHNSYGLLGLA